MLIGGKEYKTGQRIKVINAKSILHYKYTSNSGPSALNLNNPRSNSNDNIGFRSALPLCQEALRLRPQGQYKQG